MDNPTYFDDEEMNDLIQKFNKGDEDAWQTIMGKYRDRLVSICISTQLNLHMAFKPDLAEDIAQEAWLKLFARCLEGTNHFDNIGQIIKWLKETQKYLLLNIGRKAATQREKPMLEDDNGEVLLPNHINEQESPRPIEETLIKNQEYSWAWAIVDQVLGEFNQLEQDVVMRRIVGNEKPSKIAHDIGKPADYVYRVTERATNKLKSYGQAESFFRAVREMAIKRTISD
jgi:RNA polymerase sigma factor (sigma-70 family)